MIGIFSLVVH